jgi:KDO2-lipid IV(A) lauroyltransferase
MTALFYYVFLKPLSLLPLRVLYLLSDVLYLLLYRLAGYRKKVVMSNLQQSFPEKPQAEIDRLCARFYKHLCDIIVEVIHSFSISRKELLNRVKVLNPEIFQPFFDQGKSIILAGGHYNNWEIVATAMDAQIPHKVAAVYKPLGDRFLDQKMKATREQYGVKLVPKSKFIDLFEEATTTPMAITLATDQSPSNAKKAYWMEFLNQDTAVLFGTEKYAQQYDFPVIFGWVEKVRRGYFEITFEIVESDPVNAPYGAITKKHTRLLEAQIRKAPEFWLWTHKRWKKKRATADSAE